MGRLYTVSFAAVAATVQVDFFTLSTSASQPIILHAFGLSQSTLKSDANETEFGVVVSRWTNGSTVSSGGSAPTPTPLEPNLGASNFTARTMDTTKVATGTGTKTTVYADLWDVRNTPFQWVYTPEMRPMAGISQRFEIELTTTPAASTTFSGWCVVEEIG